MKQYLPIVVLALLLALTSYVAWDRYDAARQYKAQAESLNVELAAARARTAQIQARVLKADKDAAKARLDLKEALDAYPVWRDTAVPVPVYDSLCRTIRCNQPSGLPPSGSGPAK